MDVHLDSEEAAMARRDRKGKRRRRPMSPPRPAGGSPSGRPNGSTASPAPRPASPPWSVRSTTRRGTRPISLSPASWPRPVNVLRWPGTLPRSRPPPRSRSDRLKKTTPAGGPPSGRAGDHGHDPLLLSPRPHRDGTRPRGGRALSRVGRLSDQPGEPPQRPGRGRPPGRPPADRAGPRRTGPARPGVKREGGPADRQRAGSSEAGHAHPRPAPLPPRRIAGRRAVPGPAKEKRGRS